MSYTYNPNADTSSPQLHKLSFENVPENVEASSPVLAGGDVLEVRVPQNPTTGYLWVVSTVAKGVSQTGYPTSDTDMNEEDYHYEPSTPLQQREDSIVGAGGYQTLTFVAVDDVVAGEVFVLRCKRTWLPDSEDDLLITLTVRSCMTCKDKGYIYEDGPSVFSVQRPCPKGCAAAISYLGREHTIQTQSDDHARQEMSGQRKDPSQD